MNRDLCTICISRETDSEYIRLECGHEFHFQCCYDMILYGRIIKCPNCRFSITADYLDGFQFFFYREADLRSERQLYSTRLAQIRSNTPQPLPEDHIEPNILDYLLESDLIQETDQPALQPNLNPVPSLIPNRREAARRLAQQRSQANNEQPTTNRQRRTANNERD